MISVGNGSHTDVAAAVAIVARPVASGSGSPSSGKIQPPVPAASGAAPPADVRETVRQLNEIMVESQRALHFRVDESSGRTIITVVNPDTGEIVRQIPSSDRLVMSRLLDAFGSTGLLSVRT